MAIHRSAPAAATTSEDHPREPSATMAPARRTALIVRVVRVLPTLDPMCPLLSDG